MRVKGEIEADIFRLYFNGDFAIFRKNPGAAPNREFLMWPGVRLQLQPKPVQHSIELNRCKISSPEPNVPIHEHATRCCSDGGFVSGFFTVSATGLRGVPDFTGGSRLAAIDLGVGRRV